MQISIFDEICVEKKRIHYKEPTCSKINLINDLIRKDNPEVHIFRYKTLYNIYNKLYLYTYTKPLANLNYYIEDDGFSVAEIKDSSKLYLPERLKLHIDLLRKVKANSPDLEYATDNISFLSVNDQLTLFMP